MGRVSERSPKTPKHKWTRKEDEALIAALIDLCQTGWKRNNNIFRSGYTAVLEKELKSKLPDSNLKASPHIESRLKTLKKHCEAITEMRDAFGIEWRSTDCTLICYDDDVWEDWVQDHPDAKGLRNKPFPFYDELCMIFKKSKGHPKGVEDALDANGAQDIDEAHDHTDNLLLGQEGSYPENGANGKELERESNESNNEEAKSHNENGMGVDELNDDDALLGNIEGSPRVANKKRTQTSEGLWTGLEGIARVFENLLKRHEEQFSLLAGLVGREVAADNTATDKRARLNGELKRIPNLSLQARLRAASVIVSDPPKLDLFYSLSNEERKEWVSMLLSGLI